MSSIVTIFFFLKGFGMDKETKKVLRVVTSWRYLYFVALEVLIFRRLLFPACIAIDGFEEGRPGAFFWTFIVESVGLVVWVCFFCVWELCYEFEKEDTLWRNETAQRDLFEDVGVGKSRLEVFSEIFLSILLAAIIGWGWFDLERSALALFLLVALPFFLWTRSKHDLFCYELRRF